MIKKILIAIGILFLAIQFIRPEKNNSGDHQFHVSTQYPVPDDVSAIMKVACYDCHSNSTRYPWYAHVQPVAWWLGNHVSHGKESLNFSEFTSRRIAVQHHKFEEIIEKVKNKEMPLPSYTLMGLHSDADLTPEQREVLISWAEAQMDYLKTNYPADSLVLRRK